MTPLANEGEVEIPMSRRNRVVLPRSVSPLSCLVINVDGSMKEVLGHSMRVIAAKDMNGLAKRQALSHLLRAHVWRVCWQRQASLHSADLQPLLLGAFDAAETDP